MGFLDIGTGELALILVVALIIWGPKRIIEVGRTMGKLARALRKTASDLTSVVTKELEDEGKDSPH